MTQFASSALEIMRRALGRKNQNDPQSSDELMFTYLNNFITLQMSDDVKLFENFGTLTFTIDESNTSGVYTFNDLGSATDFVNISNEAFISLTDPPDNSISWNRLSIYQNPGEFFSIWGINNDEILIPGYPTMMLYYGNEFTFRTIPNTSYLVKIYGYKQNAPLSANNTPLPYDYWLRYVALGAACDYARDFRYEPSALAQLEKSFARERKLRLTRTHNQIKLSRALPRF